MRELLNEDMYILSERIDRMDLKMPPLKKEDGKVKTREELGGDMLLLFCRKVYLAKDQVNQLLSNVLDKPLDEIKKMTLKETGTEIAKLFGKAGMADFFK